MEPPPPPQWVMDLNTRHGAKSKNNSIPDPPGFPSSSSSKRPSSKNPPPPARKLPTATEMNILKIKKAWEVAIAPAKALPMNGIMMYMSGNSLQIFSMMMVWTLFKNPIVALTGLPQAFSKFENAGTREQMWMIKLVFIATNLLALGLGIWKVNGMGLLPTTRSDWLAWEVERRPLETAIFAFK